jgi:hypothetical protein
MRIEDKFSEGTLVWVESMRCVARCACGWTWLTPQSLSRVQKAAGQPIDNFAALAADEHGYVTCKFIEPISSDGAPSFWVAAVCDIRPVSIN